MKLNEQLIFALKETIESNFKTDDKQSLFILSANTLIIGGYPLLKDFSKEEVWECVRYFKSENFYNVGSVTNESVFIKPW